MTEYSVRLMPGRTTCNLEYRCRRCGVMVVGVSLRAGWFATTVSWRGGSFDEAVEQCPAGAFETSAGDVCGD